LEKIEKHKSICEKLNKLYEKKNHDYGDSFSTLRKKHNNAILIRLSDKLNRLESLYLKKDIKVEDESIVDTLIDIANYAIMEIIEIEEQK